MTDTLVARLEQVTRRLEMFADKVAAGKAADSGAAEVKIDPCIPAYDVMIEKSAKPFLECTKKIKNLDKIASMTDEGLKLVRHVVEASTVCKKPSDAEFKKFMTPILELKENMDKLADNRQPTFPYFKSWSEAMNSLLWVTTTITKPFIEAALEPAEFHLNKVLMLAKNMTGDEQKNSRDFVKLMKGMLNGMAAYALEFHKAGLNWNFKGMPIAQYKPGCAGHAPAPAGASASSSSASSASASAVPAAPECPVPPPCPEIEPVQAPPVPAGMSAASSSASSSAGMGAVFAQINAGADGGVTKGLRKVQDSEKCKNRKNEAVLTAKEHKEEKKSKIVQEEKKKPPRLYEQGATTIVCENYENAELTLNEIDTPEGKHEVEMKHMIYISKCKNLVVRVPIKVKSVQIDKCQKVAVEFQAVVSSCEVVNSSDVRMQCIDQCPSFNVDKSEIVFIGLTKKVAEQHPHIYTSNSHTITLVVPALKGDDSMELPLPYQFKSEYEPTTGKVKTEPVAHSAA